VSDHVFLTGHVKFAELIAFYKTADVFLCMSDHEGFCVPLMEAMHFDVPIVAYSSTGVPFTLGDAGILLNKKDEKIAAELAYLVAKDPEVRQKVIEKQRKRVAEFKPEILKNKYRNLIERVIAN
jgi:glycosyltransferase involved in cell wall biosynthesis